MPMATNFQRCQALLTSVFISARPCLRSFDMPWAVKQRCSVRTFSKIFFFFSVWKSIYLSQANNPVISLVAGVLRSPQKWWQNSHCCFSLFVIVRLLCSCVFGGSCSPILCGPSEKSEWNLILHRSLHKYEQRNRDTHICAAVLRLCWTLWWN